jgi:hypothetical protein
VDCAAEFAASVQMLFDTEKSHFAADAEACKNMGKKEALLGYDLKQ